MTIEELILSLTNEVSKMGGKPEVIAMAEDAFDKLAEELRPRLTRETGASEFTVTKFHGMLVFRRKDAPSGTIYVGSKEDLCP